MKRVSQANVFLLGQLLHALLPLHTTGIRANLSLVESYCQQGIALLSSLTVPYQSVLVHNLLALIIKLELEVSKKERQTLFDKSLQLSPLLLDSWKDQIVGLKSSDRRSLLISVAKQFQSLLDTKRTFEKQIEAASAAKKKPEELDSLTNSLSEASTSLSYLNSFFSSLTKKPLKSVRGDSKFIRSLIPDGNLHYAALDVLSGIMSIWKDSDSAKQIFDILVSHPTFSQDLMSNIEPFSISLARLLKRILDVDSSILTPTILTSVFAAYNVRDPDIAIIIICLLLGNSEPQGSNFVRHSHSGG